MFLFFLDIFNAAMHVFLRLNEAAAAVRWLDHLGDFLDNVFKGGQVDANFDEPLDGEALVHAEDFPSQVPHEDALKQMEKVDCQGVDC